MQSELQNRKHAIPRRGLAVDNDPFWLDDFASILESCGLVSTQAGSLEEVSDFIDRQFYFVSLVDMSLVGSTNRDGFEITKRISGFADGGEVIFISGLGRMRDGDTARNLGAVAAIDKDNFNIDEIRTMVNASIGRAEKVLEGWARGIDFLVGPPRSPDRLQYQDVILRTLQRSYTLIDSVTQSLLKDFVPLIRPISEQPPSLSFHPGAIKFDYWSRMLGGAISLSLGRRAAIHDLVAKLDRDTSSDSKVLSVLAKDDLAGAVTSNPTLHYEHFHGGSLL